MEGVKITEVTREHAMRQLNGLRGLSKRQFLEEDKALKETYEAVKGGAKILNVLDAFKATGLNEKGQPNLAIARADWKKVFFHPCASFERHGGNWRGWRTFWGGGGFSNGQQWNGDGVKANFTVPGQTFNTNALTSRTLEAKVPYVPAEHRPKLHLRNYHILFEAEWTKTYPIDPILLQRVKGDVFIVLAEWDLTEFERMVLSGLTQ